MIDVTVDDGTATVTITYTSELQKVQDVLTDAAQKLHSEGFGPVGEEGEHVVWDDLTRRELCPHLAHRGWRKCWVNRGTARSAR